MFGAAEDFLAGLDRVQPGLDLKLEQYLLLERRLRLGRDQDVERLVLGQ